MSTMLVVLVFFVSAVCAVQRPSLTFKSEHDRWANGALKFVGRLDCDDQKLTSSARCWRFARVPISSMNVYVAQAHGGQKLKVRVPDGELSQHSSGHYDGVFVIDPYPKANFGHLVLLFLVENSVSEENCGDKNTSVYLSETRQCMRLARKKECDENLHIDRSQWQPRCDTNFLPLVFNKDVKKRRKQQLLKCVDNILGFGRCQNLRARNETLNLLCDSVHVNTRRCSRKFGTVHTKCRIFETCDQAVIISGGWNREASLPRFLDNVRNIYGMFRTNGFRKGNIKVFFANGLSRGLQAHSENHAVYPSAKKVAMRYHINKMCDSAHCVDSMVIYLNGPALIDGSLLLWDVDSDGTVGHYERYSVTELMEDTEDCLANRIFIVADYSFSGVLRDMFEQSVKHRNVIVFTSGRSQEYSWDQEFTNHWANFKHSHTCVSRVHDASQTAVRHSNPERYDGSSGTIKTNIFGAPCNVYPPFTALELQRSYLGCQNVPMKVWMSKIFSHGRRS